MSIRKINNITIFAELNEDISLPTSLPVLLDGVEVDRVPVDSWYPTNYVDTSKQADLIFLATVSGYPEKVLCSVIVDGIDESPPSVFPDEIDNFGNPKVDIQTADIPDIDDFQYFKAKYPRSAVEGAQLMQLRELLADKVILARDINHLRNAVIEIEKFLKKLADKVDELERRVEKLEQETVIGGKNLGSGEGIYKDVVNRIMNFRSIKGEGDINVTTSGDEIVIGVEVPEPPPPETGCDKDIRGKSFESCGGTYKTRMSDGQFDLTGNGAFGMKIIGLKQGEDGAQSNTMIMSLGVGQIEGKGAGRLLKCQDGFIFEVKDEQGWGSNKYSGLEIRSSGVDFYRGVSGSKINAEIKDQGKNVYKVEDYNSLTRW